MGLETMALAALITAGVGAGFQAYQTGQQTKAIKKQTAAQEADAQRLAAETEKNKLQTIMRNQKRRGAVGGEPGQRDTVLTGALGLPNQPQTAQKTLLGL